MMEKWDWADAIINKSEYADLIEDCEFDEATGDHVYFTQMGAVIRVDPQGNIRETAEVDDEPAN